jgi:hypothetical protein
MLRNTLAVAVLGLLALLTACGRNPSFAPAFSTTAPLTAIQGEVYEYTFQVVAPPAAVLLYQLTTAPAGATLVGTTVSWTPTAEQACIPNNFAVSAMAAGGASATQSWTVTTLCVPVFTSSAPQMAEENVAYTYALAASTSHGVSVKFQLTTAPAGATLNGNVISWVPTSAQSRVANQFAVTATATGGGTANQSWAVTPNGTISGSCIDTYWAAQGNVAVPNDLSAYTVVAEVPQADGSFQNISGAGKADGTFSIPNVPAGYYSLKLHTPTDPLGFATFYWTNSSTFDCGTDYAGRPAQSTINGSIAVDNLNGLDSWATSDNLVLTSPNARVYCYLLVSNAISFPNWKNTSCPFDSSPANDSTTFTPTDPAPFTGPPIDPSLGDTSYVLQYESVPNGSALGPALAQPSLALTSGNADATLSGTFTSSASIGVTIGFIVEGSAWAQVYNEQGPPSATPDQFYFGLSVQPIVSSQVVAEGPPLELESLQIPQVTTDGSQQELPSYNNPFPSNWLTVFSAHGGSKMFSAECEPLPNEPLTNVCAEVGYATSTLPTTRIAPPMSPVLNPALNGTSLFTVTTTTSPTVTLSWNVPTGLTPYGYGIYVYQITYPSSNSSNSSAPSVGLMALAYTAQTSTTITLNGSEFPAVNTFVFVIRALADGGLANIASAPNHTKYPTAYADVMSGPITIGGGTASATAATKAMAGQSGSHAAGSVAFVSLGDDRK